MGDFSTLAIRIKELRVSLKMTQKEFLVFVGCTAATLSAYENGSKSPSLEIIKEVAEKCNVSIDWLCGLSNRIQHINTVETYGDAIRLLLKLEEKLDIFVSYQWNNRDCIARIDFESDHMKTFLKNGKK